MQTSPSTLFARSVLASSFALLTSGLALAADKLVIEAGRVITRPGHEIKNGVIVIENGRITKVGAQGEVDKPWDATVIGGPQYVAFPGFVEAQTSRGLDRPNENIDVAPFLDIRDSIDPINFAYEDYLRHGVTTLNVQQGGNCVIGGRGMVVRPVGMTVDEMAVRTDYALKLSASPKAGKSAATQAMALRRAFEELRKRLEKQVQDKRDGKARDKREALFQGRELEGDKAKGRAMEGKGWRVDGLELVPRGELDEKDLQLLELVEGKRDAYVWCAAAMDVRKALDLAKENGFLERTTLVLAGDCWKAADVVAASGRPAILIPPLLHVETEPITGKEVETPVAKVFAEKGVKFAIASETGQASSLPSHHVLWYQAALAIGQGLPRERAIAAVTTVPAEILGLRDRVGSLEEGKDGNVLLLDGEPLSVRTHVQFVVIEGKTAYDRSKDIRLKHLLEGKEPPGTQAGAADFGAAGAGKADAKKDALKQDEAAERKAGEEQRKADEKQSSGPHFSDADAAGEERG
ncbi:MAG: amidohydrolase family protein [Planctomycetes bacterium]|nr:amidohydrolase family protein [Planctomycetota bacterium]